MRSAYAGDMHIVLIEDHRTVADNIATYLTQHGYAVTVAYDGTQGQEIACTQATDLILLDINLPGQDGLSLTAQVRAAGKTMPILLLSARDTADDIIAGLDAGADDYLVKPFDLGVLLAHVRALLRRPGSGKGPLLQAGQISFDPSTQTVRRNTEIINLSPKATALLEFLLRRRGTVADRPTILEHVWGGGDEIMLSNTVDVHVAMLRRKLGNDAIRTVPNIGYLIPDDET